MTSPSGQVTYAQSYDPYGTVRGSSQLMPGTSTAYGFTGEQQDPSGMVYLRARYYNSSNGNFISRDTFAGYNTSSQSQNRFAYTQNNPIRYTDPTGHYSLEDFKAEARSLFNDPVKHTLAQIQKNRNMPWECTDVGQIALWAAPAIMPLVIVAAIPIIIFSPDSIIDLAFLAYDASIGDSHAFALDAMGLMIPGVTGLGALSHADEVYDAARAVNSFDNLSDTRRLFNSTDDLSDASHFVNSKEGIINDLMSGTAQSKAIAEAIQNGQIKTNIWSDDIFEEFLRGKGETPEKIAQTLAFNINERIYLRASSESEVYGYTVHEGVHALDYLDYIAGKYKGKSVAELHSWERRAYYYERQFLQYKSRSMPGYMNTLPEMLQHIFENY